MATFALLTLNAIIGPAAGLPNMRQSELQLESGNSQKNDQKIQKQVAAGATHLMRHEAYQQPEVAAQPQAWDEVCASASVGPKQKSVALLLRGHSYADLGHWSNSVGSISSMTILTKLQNDILDNYRTNIIDPFCKMGINVDVFVATAMNNFTSQLIKITAPKASSVHGMAEETPHGEYSSQSATYLHLLKDVFAPHHQQRQLQKMEYEYIIAARFDTALKDTLPSYMDASDSFKPDGFNFPFKETAADWQRQKKSIDHWWDEKIGKPERDHRVGDVLHIWHPKHTQTWISFLEEIDHLPDKHMHLRFAYDKLAQRIPDGDKSLGFLVPGYYSSVASDEWIEPKGNMQGNTACLNPLYRILPRDLYLAGQEDLQDKCQFKSDFAWREDLKSYWCKGQNCGIKYGTHHAVDKPPPEKKTGGNIYFPPHDIEEDPSVYMKQQQAQVTSNI